MNRAFLNIVEYYHLQDSFLLDQSIDLNSSLWNLQLRIDLQTLSNFLVLYKDE